MKTIDIFCQWWGVGIPISKLPNEIYMIGLVSFGATPKRLTFGSQWVVILGKELRKRFPNAWIVSGEFTGNPVVQLEEKLKIETLGTDLITAGSVISTIQEAEAWRNCVSPSFFPKTLVVATDEMHSRSARRVSNRVWNGWWGLRLIKRLLGMPLVQVWAVTFQTGRGIDPYNPMVALRSQWLWVRNNVARELFLMLVPFGFSIMRRLNIHQPIADIE